MKGAQPKDVDHTVEVSGFKIGKYEVSNQEYKKFKPGHTGARSNLDNPVESVTWDDAQAYCRWLSEKTGKSYRLPTEAEWEYACRAGSTTDYYWGENSNGENSGSPSINDYAWCVDNSGEIAHPVGQKKLNDWGLYDMSGNVIEWCSDWYSADYYGESPEKDPQGPLDGTERVIRGSEFRESGESCQSGWRFQTPPDTRDKGLGFRLVLDETPKVGTPVTITYSDGKTISSRVIKVTEEFAAVSYGGNLWFRISSFQQQANNQWTVNYQERGSRTEPLRLPPNTIVGARIFMVPTGQHSFDVNFKGHV